MKFSTSQLIIGGYAASLVILGIIALFAFLATREYAASVTERRHVSDRLEALHRYQTILKDAETAKRGYLLSPAHEDYLAPYVAARAKWKSEFQSLKDKFDGASAKDQELLEQLHGLSDEKMQELAKALRQAQIEPTSSEEFQRLLARGRGLMDGIRDVVSNLEARQREGFEAANTRVQAVSSATVLAVSVLSPLAVALVIGALALILRDLKARTLAEEALKQQRILLSGIVNSMNEGVVVANETGQLVMFNPAGERLIGRGPIPSGPEKWTEEYGVFEPDTVTPMAAEKLPLVRALRGETFDFTDLYIRPAGGQSGRFLAGTASPLIDEFGAARGGVVILRDITERRAAERRFQSLLESAPDALVIADQRGIIRLINAQTERLFQYSREQLIGEAIEILVPLRARAAHPAQRDSFFANPLRRPMGSGLELHGRRADGSEFPIEISLAPVEGDEGPLVCAAIRDVTDRRQVMDRIRQLNDELEDRVAARTSELATANDELTQRNQENEMFVYSVSHDLRSPLVNLQGFSQELDSASLRLRALAENPSAPPEVREQLADIVDNDITESIHFIRTSVLRLSGIIDALLRLSRAGRVVYQWQSIDVASIVERVVGAAHGTITERGAEVVIGDLPAAWGDPTAVEQVFGNLIQNALHYLSPERPARIEIGASAETDRASERCTYFVRDNGIGIPPALQAKIFQAFQRLAPRHAPGEGMGLTLVQRIIERHGGRIWVESTPGAGSTFYFLLPSVANRETDVLMPTTNVGERL